MTILYCGCTGVTEISAKTGQKVKSFCTNIPFNTRNAGATFQDKKLGKGMRLFNLMKNGSHRCTVCGKVRS